MVVEGERLDSLVIQVPNFEDWDEVINWEADKEEENWDSRKLIEFYKSLEAPISYGRAALYASYIPDINEAILLTHKGFACARTRLEQLYLIALESYFSLNEDADILQLSHSNMIGVLSHQLDEARRQAPQGTLRMEVEIRLLQALMNCYAHVGELDQVMFRAGEMVQIARMLNIPSVISSAGLKYRWALQITGCYQRALSKKDLLIDDNIEKSSILAYSYVNLGDFESAIKAIDAALVHSPNSDHLELLKRYFKAIYGFLDPDKEAIDDYINNQDSQSGIFRHIGMSALIEIIRADRVLPSARSEDEKEAYYQCALKSLDNTFVPSSPNPIPANEAFKGWVRAKLRIERKEFGLATQEMIRLAKKTPLAQEDLLTRALIGGAHLELAVRPGNYQTQNGAIILEDLQAVFKDAQQFEDASLEGLATLLWRWHPFAAAILAVAPNPIPCFAHGTDGIIRINSRSRLQGLALPPWYVAQQICLYFGLDAPSQSWVGNEIPQRRALLTQWETLEIVRPVVTGAHLAYALLKIGQGQSDYRSYAEQVASTYGLFPESCSAKMPSASHQLQDMLQSLISGGINVMDFESRLLKLETISQSIY